MNKQVITIEETPILVVLHTGPYTEIYHAFTKLLEYALQNGLFNPPATKSYGLYFDDPDSTKPEDLRSAAAITYDKEVELPDFIEKSTIPAGKYFVSYQECGMDGFTKAWYDAFDELQKSGYEYEPSGVSMEEYLNDPDTHPEKLAQFNILIAVK